MEIVRDFAVSTIRDIERNHGVVFDPFETSLSQLEIQGRSVLFYSRLWNNNIRWYYINNGSDFRFRTLSSRPTQVAIFPDPQQIYVPESNRKSLKQQQELLEADLVEVVKKKMGIGGTEEVIDTVATHAGLVFAYSDKTNGKIRLHGRDYNHRYVRSRTLTAGPYVAIVGRFNNNGLDIRDCYKVEGRDDVWALRLLVPAQE